MKLEPLMTLHVVSKPIEIGTGPQGTRTIFNVTGGTFEGSRLRGTVLPNGGDWLLVDSEGVGRLDVRLTLATDDGARRWPEGLRLRRRTTGNRLPTCST